MGTFVAQHVCLAVVRLATVTAGETGWLSVVDLMGFVLGQIFKLFPTVSADRGYGHHSQLARVWVQKGFATGPSRRGFLSRFGGVNSSNP